MKLAQARGAWLAERRAAQAPRVPFQVGAVLPVLGIPRRIERAARLHAAARLAPDAIVTGGADEAATARRIELLLRREAKTWLSARAGDHAATLGLPPCPVTVRETRSRWGSCSTAPSLSFSWRLVLAPPEVADYVAAHEVAHRLQMNHSPAFWGIVEGLSPNYRRHEAWLKANGATLHAYG